MANFPVANITAARVNVLKGELTVQLRVPFNPDTEADVLQQAAGLRRMFEAEVPVTFMVRPVWEQPELLPAAPAPDWQDRPTGDTLGDFLSSEDAVGGADA